MSSETSTETVPLKADRADQSLQPWQFFVLAALVCATAVTFIVRGEGLTPVILLSALMGAIALVGLAVVRAVRPLVSEQEDRTVMIGERTRAALEREKMLALRAIKELEFDHAMGKIAPADFAEMEARLRARAIRLMKQLDAGAGYRERIEQDLAKRMGAASRTPDLKGRAYDSPVRPEGVVYDGPVRSEGVVHDGPVRPEGVVYDGPVRPEGVVYDGPVRPEGVVYDGPVRSEGVVYDGPVRREGVAYDTTARPEDVALGVPQNTPELQGPAYDSPSTAARVCSGCSTLNDTDARFCKRCGQPL